RGRARSTPARGGARGSGSRSCGTPPRPSAGRSGCSPSTTRGRPSGSRSRRRRRPTTPRTADRTRRVAAASKPGPLQSGPVHALEEDAAMHRTSPVISRTLALAVVAATGLAAPASAQNAHGSGRALDANLQQGGSRYNPPGRNANIAEEVRFRNAIVTGNAPGGLSFRGDAG